MRIEINCALGMTSEEGRDKTCTCKSTHEAKDPDRIKARFTPDCLMHGECKSIIALEHCCYRNGESYLFLQPKHNRCLIGTRNRVDALFDSSQHRYRIPSPAKILQGPLHAVLQLSQRIDTEADGRAVQVGIRLDSGGKKRDGAIEVLNAVTRYRPIGASHSTTKQ